MATQRRWQRLVHWLERRVNLTEIFSLLSIFGLFYRQVDTNKPLMEAVSEALEKPIPAYARWPRVLGLFCLILFLFEVFTGVLLAFYYQASPPEAYESVLIIVRDVNLGWFVRQMHYWGAQLLLIILIARLLRFYFRGLYRTPREVIWVAGAVLFILATHLDFSGRVLSWNNDSYWSSVRALEVLFAIPLLGSFFSFLVGGIEANSLSRFYFFHVVLLPLLFWCGLYFSFSSIRRVGLSQIRGERARQGKRAYLGHLHSMLILFLLIFGILVSLSVLYPIDFGKPINPYETPTGSMMPWYLLAPYGLIEFLPRWVSLEVRSSILLVLLLVFVFFPFLDPSPKPSESRKRAAQLFGIVVFVLWVFFSIYGRFLDLPAG